MANEKSKILDQQKFADIYESPAFSKLSEDQQMSLVGGSIEETVAGSVAGSVTTAIVVSMIPGPVIPG